MSPADGIVVETGIKAAWRDGLLNGSAAIYGIQQRGLPRIDRRFPFGNPRSAGCCNLPQSTNRSKGVDLELSGNLRPGWHFAGGYTYNNNRDENGVDLSLETPRHLLQVWTSTQLPDRLRAWTVGLPRGGIWYGEPRNFLLRLNASF